jgi:hypothetical protein
MIPLFRDFWDERGQYLFLSENINKNKYVLHEGADDFWDKYISIVSGMYPSGFISNYRKQYIKATGCEEVLTCSPKFGH